MNSRKNAIAVLIAVLLIGCLLGASGFWLWRARDSGISHETGLESYDRSLRIFGHLDLTSDQKNSLQSILEESRRQITDCQGEMQNRMDAIRTQTNRKIGAILDDDQRKEFERLLREAESHRGQDHGGRGRKPRVR